MGANDKFAAAFHPSGRSGVEALLAAADAVRDRILGFLVQCETCPQIAIVATQPSPGWLCPRCAEVVEEPEQPIGERPDVAHLRSRAGDGPW